MISSGNSGTPQLRNSSSGGRMHQLRNSSGLLEVAGEGGTAVVCGPDHPLFLLNCPDPEEEEEEEEPLRRGEVEAHRGSIRSFLHAYQQLGVHIPLTLPSPLRHERVTPSLLLLLLLSSHQVPRTILVLSERPLDETRHDTVAHR